MHARSAVLDRVPLALVVRVPCARTLIAPRLKQHRGVAPIWSAQKKPQPGEA
jgi:hypothetical protein